MIFQDTKAPTLKTEFAEDSHTHDLSNNNHFTYSIYSPKTGETTVPSMTKSFAESCTQAGETYDRSATVASKPCSYTLLHGSLASIFGYEELDNEISQTVTLRIS